MVNNRYRIYFKKQYEAEITKITLPVNPATLPTSRSSENEDKNVIGIGPIMLPRIPALRKVTVSSYFPGRVDSLTLDPEDFKEPKFYIDFFDRAMTNKEILNYGVIRIYENGVQYMAEDAGMDCLVTNFSYEERGAETGDFYFDLELTEYKDYTPQQVVLTDKTDSTTGVPVAVKEETRNIPQGQLYVGAKAKINGNYYYTSYGDEPHGTGNGRTCVVSRISEGRDYPVHVNSESGGALGWCKKESLQVVQ